MGIALFILSFACICGMWYITGRNSIYNKLKADYREALNLIGFQQAIIEAYKRKYESKETEKEDGEQDNIAEILRDMPKGTKLYSPLFGKCELVDTYTGEGDEPIRVEPFCGGVSRTFSSKGRYFERYQDAECLLFPSDRMRCWGKFFKRGDVLVDEDLETAVVFDGWANDDYTEFNTAIDYYKISGKKISSKWGKGDICCTLLFRKATDEERAEFIAAAEKYYGGKYNPETLQVEPIKVAEPKCLLKPFDKVLVRDSDAGIWKAAHFSHYIGEYEYPYFTTASAYKQCVPYDCNEHLLGTNKSPE